MSSLKI